jgi:hypothetical protein
MIQAKTRMLPAGIATASVIIALGFAYAQQGPRGKSSCIPVDIEEPFSACVTSIAGPNGGAQLYER